MNKYMLLAASCMILQGLDASVELDVKVDNNTQTVLLEEGQKQICVFDDVSVVICNKEEQEGSVLLEVAISKDENVLFESSKVVVDFEKKSSITVESEEAPCGVEISATKN